MIRATDLDLIGEATARGVRHLLPRQANDNGLPYSDYGLGGGRQICFARRAFAQPGPQAGGCARRRSSQVLFIIRTRVLYHRCDEKPARKFMFYPRHIVSSPHAVQPVLPTDPAPPGRCPSTAARSQTVASVSSPPSVCSAASSCASYHHRNTSPCAIRKHTHTRERTPTTAELVQRQAAGNARGCHRSTGENPLLLSALSASVNTYVSAYVLVYAVYI